MPSDHDGPTAPQQATAVAQRYRRLERPTSFGVAAAVGLVIGVAFVVLTLVQTVLVAFVAAVTLRFPVFRPGSRATLATDATPVAVRRAFESACPPALAFQWGIADEIEQTEAGWAYEVSSLFGLQSSG